MLITPLTQEDCEKAALLHQSAFFKGWTTEDFSSFLSTPYIYGFKLTARQKFIGYILWKQVEEEAEILTFVIGPSSQRAGKGSLLINELINYLKIQKIKKVFLEVAEDNDAAIAFYHSHEFIFLNKRARYYERENKKLVDALCFFKKLD